jgi:hypothetical protein
MDSDDEMLVQLFMEEEENTTTTTLAAADAGEPPPPLPTHCGLGRASMWRFKGWQYEEQGAALASRRLAF